MLRDGETAGADDGGAADGVRLAAGGPPPFVPTCGGSVVALSDSMISASASPARSV